MVYFALTIYRRVDFVFEEDYELKTIGEVEDFINENGHLPDIPPAAQSEEHGLEVGEMSARLLQKIEELTLYTIEQQKQLDEQAKLIKELSQGSN